MRLITEKIPLQTERAEDGWYQLSLDLPALPKDRRVFIEFDGVAIKSKAFCNGRPLGEHVGMFSRFVYDLTPHLKVGRNLISVFVSMEKIPVSTLSLGQAVTVNLTARRGDRDRRLRYERRRAVPRSSWVEAARGFCR